MPESGTEVPRLGVGGGPEAPVVGAAGSETPAVVWSAAVCVGGGVTTGAPCVGGGAAPLVRDSTEERVEVSVKSISMGALQENKKGSCQNYDKRNVVDNSNKRERKTR